MQSKEAGELTCHVYDTEDETVEIQRTGLGFKYSVHVSTVDQAITELRLILAWLEEIHKGVDH